MPIVEISITRPSFEKPRRRKYATEAERWDAAAERKNARVDASLPLFALAGMTDEMHTDGRTLALSWYATCLFWAYCHRMTWAHGEELRLVAEKVLNADQYLDAWKKVLVCPLNSAYYADLWWNAIKDVRPELAESLRPEGITRASAAKWQVSAVSTFPYDRKIPTEVAWWD